MLLRHGEPAAELADDTELVVNLSKEHAAEVPSEQQRGPRSLGRLGVSTELAPHAGADERKARTQRRHRVAAMTGEERLCARELLVREGDTTALEQDGRVLDPRVGGIACSVRALSREAGDGATDGGERALQVARAAGVDGPLEVLLCSHSGFFSDDARLDEPLEGVADLLLGQGMLERASQLADREASRSGDPFAERDELRVHECGLPATAARDLERVPPAATLDGERDAAHLAEATRGFETRWRERNLSGLLGEGRQQVPPRWDAGRERAPPFVGDQALAQLGEREIGPGLRENLEAERQRVVECAGGVPHGAGNEDDISRSHFHGARLRRHALLPAAEVRPSSGESSCPTAQPTVGSFTSSLEASRQRLRPPQLDVEAVQRSK